MAEPPAVEERGLVDDVVAAADGGLGEGGFVAKAGAPILDRLVLLDARDAAARGLEAGQMALLVLEPAILHHLQLRVFSYRPLDEPRRGRELERGEMLAGEEADEVGGREDGLSVDQLHEEPCPGL